MRLRLVLFFMFSSIINTFSFKICNIYRTGNQPPIRRPFNVEKRPFIHTTLLQKKERNKKTEINFFGPNENFLGIGTTEAIVIFGVGWLLLGPSELYKLTKELGNVIGNVREAFTSITKSFSETMEQEVGLSEAAASFRKGQIDLDSLWGNNVDEEEDFDDDEELNLEDFSSSTSKPNTNDKAKIYTNNPGISDKFAAQLDIDRWNQAILSSEVAPQTKDLEPSIAKEPLKSIDQATDYLDEEELMLRKLQNLADMEEERMLEMQSEERLFTDKLVLLKMETLSALEEERRKRIEELEERFNERREFIESMFSPVPQE